MAAAHLEKTGEAHQGLEIVQNHTAHLLVKVMLLARSGGVEEGLPTEEALGKAESNGIGRTENRCPELIQGGWTRVYPEPTADQRGAQQNADEYQPPRMKSPVGRIPWEAFGDGLLPR
jgi:hypothetical protein